MGFPPLLSLFVALILLEGGLVIGRENASSDNSVRFDQNYQVSWGFDHFLPLNQSKEIQLSMDISSGAGIRSKQRYSSGFIQMRIKLPEKDSAGVVTAFYMHSHAEKHDELDFEFLGNREGKPYTLQTNVYTDGVGDKEERLHLWFDPTSHFHAYKLLWNPHQIVFFIDNIPIRVVKNLTNLGVNYPSQAMQIEASIWNGDNWATDGGQTKINWSHAPFKAQFQKFDINGCRLQTSSGKIPASDSSKYWWNDKKYWRLDESQQKAYENVKKNYMNYDYCEDRPRYPIPPLECSYQ